MTVLDVHPAGYGVAARTVGGEIATSVTVARDLLVSALGACGGMGGSDDIGVHWSASYDETAAAVVSGLTDLTNAAYTVGALLEQSGINYAGAEAASVPGETAAQTVARYASSSAAPSGNVPSASGAGLPPPHGWTLLDHLIGAMWPDGHQDRLHQAGDAWSDLVVSLSDATADLYLAADLLREQRAPEVADAVEVMHSLARQLNALESQGQRIADSCHEYAHHLDRAHSEIIRECVEFINITIAAELAGAGLAIVTFGLSEAAAQTAVAAAGCAAARAINAAIDVLRAAALPVAADLDALAVRAAEVGVQLRPVLARSVVQASVSHPGVLGQITPIVGNPTLIRLEKYADDYLILVDPPSQTWGNLVTLARHFHEHAKPLGLTSPEAYARAAADFRLRAIRTKLPSKLDKAAATVRFFDPETGVVGFYRLDGRTRSYFLPRKPESYWKNQDGVPFNE